MRVISLPPPTPPWRSPLRFPLLVPYRFPFRLCFLTATFELRQPLSLVRHALFARFLDLHRVVTLLNAGRPFKDRVLSVPLAAHFPGLFGPTHDIIFFVIWAFPAPSLADRFPPLFAMLFLSFVGFCLFLSCDIGEIAVPSFLVLIAPYTSWKMF